jgi:hypothetical protein
MYPYYYKNLLVVYKDSSDGTCAAWTIPTCDRMKYLPGILPTEEELSESIVFLLGFTPEDMKSFMEKSLFVYIFLSSPNIEELRTEKSFCIFDPERTVCQITWDFFHPHEPRPWFVESIGTRSEEVLGSLYSLRNMDTYNVLNKI